jgi:hypothetical protein
MKKIVLTAALLTALASPAFAQSNGSGSQQTRARAQSEEGIFSGAPANENAYQYHQMLEQSQGS